MVGRGVIAASTAVFSPESIAQQIQGTVLGNPADINIERIDTLENACPKTLSWAANQKHTERVAKSKAGVVVVPASIAEQLDQSQHPVQSQRCFITVEDPELALVKLLHLFNNPTGAPKIAHAGVHSSATIDPTATVDPTAWVGPRVVIASGAAVGPRTILHPGVVIGKNARVGADCELRSNVVIEHACTIGDRVTIHANATIGADGFGYIFRNARHVKIPQIGTVIIEDDVEIGANSCVDRARTGTTRIGRGTKIDNHVQIAHNCDIGQHVVIAAMTGIGGSTTIGDYTMIAGHVGISDHIRIGKAARVAAKSVVTRHVRPGELVRGYPAVENKQYIREQLALRKLPDLLERIAEAKK